MKNFLMLVTSFCLGLVSCSQNNTKLKVQNKPEANEVQVGGGCENCRGIYECPVPFSELNEVDTLPGFSDPGPQIEISGVIYKRDGKTPAPGVILYIYQTDQKGIYPKRNTSTGYERNHGYIRGWIRTNAKGEYKFYTLVPASYPNSRNPQHIHPTIKEPGKSEYWIDEYHFESDPLLPAEAKNATNPRGSNGVLKTRMENGILKATRDIVLGLNVSNYPVE